MVHGIVVHKTKGRHKIINKQAWEQSRCETFGSLAPGNRETLAVSLGVYTQQESFSINTSSNTRILVRKCWP